MLEKDITDVDGVNLAEMMYNSTRLTEGSNELIWVILALDAAQHSDSGRCKMEQRIHDQCTSGLPE